MRTISENLNWRPKTFSVLEILCPEPKDTEIGPNTLSTLFRLQRKKLLEEAEATTLTYEKDTETEICPEPKDTEIGPNTLSTLFRLQRKKLLEEAEATTSTNKEDTETENSLYVKRRKTL